MGGQSGDRHRRVRKNINIKWLTPFPSFAMKEDQISVSGETKVTMDALLESLDTIQGAGSGVQVGATVATYKPGSEVNLDSSVEGAMSSMAAGMQLPIPKYSTIKTEINGWEARRVSASFPVTANAKTQSMVVEFLVIGAGPTLAQVVVLRRSNGAHDGQETTERILKSVTMAAPTKAPSP